MSAEDVKALERLEAFLEEYADRPGGALPYAIPLTWAALRRVAKLARREASAKQPSITRSHP